jgi:glycosyltransferase involved in cell wall biosynthesis
LQVYNAIRKAFMRRTTIHTPAAATPDSGRPLQLADYPGLVSVVIPAYNEAPRVRRTLTETVEALDEIGANYEIILVDDGSQDGTASLARQAASRLERVRVVGSEVNLGKGSALARGAYCALGDLVLFVDADLEVHPRQLELLYETMARDDADVVIGSKMHHDSQIDYPLKRRIISLGYYGVVHSLFKLPVKDTQTGLKLYKREVLLRVIPRLLVKRYAHDLEALVNAHRLGYRVTEAPVVVTRERAYNRIGIRDVIHVSVDTAAIWWRTYVLRYYDRVGMGVDDLLARMRPLEPADLEQELALPVASESAAS